MANEAVRLVSLLHELLPDQVGVIGLAALLHVHQARSPARLSPSGEPVRLPGQDRSLWDRREIEKGLALLGVALRRPPTVPDRYVVQAAIAACHDLALTWAETRWSATISWYDVVLTALDTPVVRLNRAVAVGEMSGAGAGLADLERVDGLDDYLPVAVARAELLSRRGRADAARAAFRAALTLPGNEATSCPAASPSCGEPGCGGAVGGKTNILPESEGARCLTPDTYGVRFGLDVVARLRVMTRWTIPRISWRRLLGTPWTPVRRWLNQALDRASRGGGQA